jgi:Fe-S-cluster containining protein
VVTDLVEIRRLGELKKQENLDFRRYLSAHHYPIEPFQRLASDIQSRIDCKACANCCRHTLVPVTQTDIEAVAAHLNMDAEDVRRKYTVADPAAPTARILLNAADACVFLDGNLCVIYQARPALCRSFPNLAPRPTSTGGTVAALSRHAALCPIVYNALEAYKRLVGYPGSK